MKTINEAKKEALPVSFLTQTVSKSWEEIGNLKSSIEGIKENFSGTEKVSKILQDLIDAYLICVGQLELHLDKKDYLDMPEEKELQESYFAQDDSFEFDPEVKTNTEDSKENLEDQKTEIHTELPDFNVEVEQKGDKVEIELEPKDEEEKKETIPQAEFDYFVDFEEPEPNMEIDNKIKEWKNRFSD